MELVVWDWNPQLNVVISYIVITLSGLCIITKSVLVKENTCISINNHVLYLIPYYLKCNFWAYKVDFETVIFIARHGYLLIFTHGHSQILEFVQGKNKKELFNWFHIHQGWLWVDIVYYIIFIKGMHYIYMYLKSQSQFWWIDLFDRFKASHGRS